jgi:protein-tyrosine phosphatase
MTVEYSRYIYFESVLNFRDLGGYRTHDGCQVAWRRIFRSGGLLEMTGRDIVRLKEEIKLAAAIDLRNPRKQEQQQEISLLDKAGARYYNIPFREGGDLSLKKEMESYRDFSNMGEVYLYRIRQKEFGQRVIEALEIIAEPDNQPLIFHCSIGKDRSGVLAAFVLGVIGVPDEDIIDDYTLTSPYMKEIFDRLHSDPDVPEFVKNLPGYTWEASAESMVLFLTELKREYGSIREYVEAQGADRTLFHRLEKTLLV